ncbi:hypothetical protein LINPERHAP1_LOCUS21589 [Linum perenne]
MGQDVVSPPRKMNSLGGEQCLVEKDEEEIAPEPAGFPSALQVNLGASRWMRDLNVVMHGDDDVSLRPVITHDDRKRHRTEPARTNVEVDGRLNGICSSSPAYLVTEICMRLPRSRWASEEMRILVFGITIRKEYIRLSQLTASIKTTWLSQPKTQFRASGGPCGTYLSLQT